MIRNFSNLRNHFTLDHVAPLLLLFLMSLRMSCFCQCPLRRRASASDVISNVLCVSAFVLPVSLSLALPRFALAVSFSGREHLRRARGGRRSAPPRPFTPYFF